MSVAITGDGPNIALTGSGSSFTITVTTGGGGVTDHGALTGLGDDDHTQYAKKASNLSDLTSASTARTNLGLGTAATAASTDFAAAEVTPLVADLVLGVAAVDGSATVFEVLNYSRGASASGVVPADWVSVFTVPDVATLDGLLAMAGLTTAKVLVPGEDAVYRIVAGSIDDPWTDITPAVGTVVFGNAATDYWQGKITPEGLQAVEQTAADVPYTGSGLFTVNTTVQTAVDNAEGTLDRIRVVAAFSTSDVDLSGYVGVGSVAVQPTLDEGTVPIEDADVFLFSQTDPAENGCYLVTSPDGVWVKYDSVSVFDPPGNGYRVFVNDPSSTAHGTIFMWLDADQTVKHRGSGTYPGSGDGGEWVRYAPPSQDLTTAPGGGTVDVVSNVATARILGRTTSGSGDSEELTAAQTRSLIGVGWHVIHDETLGSAGLFNEPSLSGYTRVRITVTGQVDSTGASSSGVRMRLNGDTGSNYGTQTAGYGGSWNGVGSFTTVLTNTDRSSMWQCELELGGVGRHTVGSYRNAHVVSTGTVGTALGTGSLYYVNTSAAITSFEVYNAAAANFTAGSRMIVEAWV